MDSDFINAEQKQSEDIFNFFCELRNNPQNHLSEAQKYGLQKIISTATEKAIEGDIKSLIRNSFFELYFDKCVKASPQSKENILQSLEKEEKLKIYEKKLYMIEGDSQKPEDCVWNLLKNSENEVRKKSLTLMAKKSEDDNSLQKKLNRLSVTVTNPKYLDYGYGAILSTNAVFGDDILNVLTYYQQMNYNFHLMLKKYHQQKIEEVI